jgi:hypothetical protein
MLNCWKIKDSDRPSFKSIFETLKNIYQNSEEASWSKYPSIRNINLIMYFLISL